MRCDKGLFLLWEDDFLKLKGGSGQMGKVHLKEKWAESRFLRDIEYPRNTFESRILKLSKSDNE